MPLTVSDDPNDLSGKIEKSYHLLFVKKGNTVAELNK
jgi:hypothetical protein